MNILLAWIGKTDLNAAAGEGKVGSGPICAAGAETRYDQVILLNNYPAKDGSRYVKWLRRQTESEVEHHNISLPSPTDFGEIYKAVVKTLEQMRAKYGADVRPTFHLSPGKLKSHTNSFLRVRAMPIMCSGETTESHWP